MRNVHRHIAGTAAFLTALTGATAHAVAAEVTVTEQARTLNAWFLTQAPAPPATARVCVVDRGTDLTPDTQITDRRWVWGDGPIGDLSADGHGTNVAQLVAAPANGWGIVGAAPQVGVVSVGVGAEQDAGWAALSAAVWACSRIPEVRVISISSAPPAGSTAEADQFAGQVTLARDRGISVVVAAGNQGTALTGLAAVPGVIPVAAARADGSGLCAFASHGLGALAAQGCGVEATTTTGAPVRLDGTSFAAPQVAGVLAALRAYRPDLDRDTAERLLTDTARSGPADVRLVDASALFAAAGLQTLVREPPTPVASLTRRGAPAARLTSTGRTAVRISVRPLAIGWRVIWRGSGVRRLTRSSLVAVRSTRPRTIRIAVARTGTTPSAWRSITIPSMDAPR